jgi:hypothetical protein
MAAAQQFETITMPDAGIGSFLTSNMDEVDDNVLMFGREGGINSMKEVADRMAKMGRGTDTYIIHASDREVILPQEVGDKNPELVARIKAAIDQEGGDGEAYVVGSDRNNINPETGLIEMKFSLSKIVKKVKNVFKKAAKVILPVAINFIAPGLGTIASAAIGAGIGGLIQGESLGQALKSAALGGITAGVASGISGAISGEGFMTGLKGGLPASYSGSGLKGAFPSASDFALRKSGDPMFMGTGFKGTEGYSNLVSKQAADAALAAKPFDLKAEYLKNVEANIPSAEAMTLAQSAEKTATAAAAAAKPSMMSTALKFGLPALGIASATGMLDPIPASEIDIEGFDETDTSETRLAENPEIYSTGVPTKAPGYITPSQAIYSGQPLTTAAYLPSQGTYNPIVPSATYASLTPSGAGTMVPSSGGASTYVPPAPVTIPGYDSTVTGMRPAPLYGVDAQGNPIYSPYIEPIRPASYVEPEVQMAAAGGPMTMNREGQRNMALDQFPRRTGQIQGPGTETSDDIPAMLSDGEFVMTAQAVRGAGNGSREQGFKKMYDIMRAFEGGAVA